MPPLFLINSLLNSYFYSLYAPSDAASWRLEFYMRILGNWNFIPWFSHFPFSEMDVFSSRRTFWNRIIMHIWCRTVDEMIDAVIYLGKLPRSLQNLILYVMLEIYHSIHIQGNCSFQDFASGDQLNISDDIAWFRVMGLQFFNII